MATNWAKIPSFFSSLCRSFLLFGDGRAAYERSIDIALRQRADALANRRFSDLIVVWELDRLGRSLQHLIGALGSWLEIMKHW
ncbi:MAG: hypothetical protein H0X24_11735 [Ktedonobacterales bacterium]|nr:hypothetical protein [Ktedonobacterales bacterium]